MQCGNGLNNDSVSLGFDSDVCSIAADWIASNVDGRRRAVVACMLRNKSAPAILHLKTRLVYYL